MIALLYKGLYITEKHVEVSTADDSFMLPVTEPQSKSEIWEF